MDSQEIQILEPLALPVPGLLAMRFRVPKSLTRQADMPTPLTTTFSACKLPNKIRQDEFGSYLFIKDEEGPSGYHEFIFAPSLTNEQAQTPYRTYYDTEPSMFWPKVLLSIQAYKRLLGDGTYVIRPRYKEAYQGPTRVRIEEFYSPSPFTIPVYEPMLDRGLNEEIGAFVSTPIIVGQSGGGQSLFYSVGNLSLDPCLHGAISLSVAIEPPIVVTIPPSITFVYDRAYLSDGATNYRDWPNEIVIDDRQREILGGFVRRRVTALSPAITKVTSPTVASLSFTTVTLGGTVVIQTQDTISSRGVVYALSADNANPEVDEASTINATSGSGPGLFTVARTGLRPSSTYSFKPWALTSGQIRVYGPVTTFTTTALVTAPTSASLTSSGATLGGTLASGSGLTVESRGVSYALTANNANPEFGGTNVTTPTAISGGTTGTFSQAVTGLAYLSAYSFKPWALTTEHGRIYGPVGTFTTAAPTVTVTSPAATTPTSNATTLSGTVNCDEPAFIATRGVVYALTADDANPEVGDPLAISLTSGGSTGSFSQAISGLTPDSEYKYKIWALTDQDVRVYSSVATFTTAAAP
jgi:hypothetical protein